MKRELRLTRGEYWLLETVVEARIPLCWLDWPSMEEALNKQGHGLDRSRLLRTLYRLFRSGLIEAHRFHDPEDYFIPSRQEISAALDETQSPGQNPMYYGLTGEGGAAWEAFAAPTWQRFIDLSFQPLEASTTEIGQGICADRGRLERYVDGLSYTGITIDSSTMVWDELIPWQATYWKTLPRGYQVTFHCQRSEEPSSWDRMPLSYYLVYENRWYSWR
ncbi:MAG: hypothetical protein EHM41_26000 [Chloroflexi bacterium]|nr:MAG: hypothetical protein EHM41_26000 [Chloroflexota bacterium]